MQFPVRDEGHGMVVPRCRIAVESKSNRSCNRRIRQK